MKGLNNQILKSRVSLCSMINQLLIKDQALSAFVLPSCILQGAEFLFPSSICCYWKQKGSTHSFFITFSKIIRSEVCLLFHTISTQDLREYLTTADIEERFCWAPLALGTWFNFSFSLTLKKPLNISPLKSYSQQCSMLVNPGFTFCGSGLQKMFQYPAHTSI